VLKTCGSPGTPCGETVLAKYRILLKEVSDTKPTRTP
jgi:hypothetical protein